MEKTVEKYLCLLTKERQLKEELEKTREELSKTARDLNRMLPPERGVLVEIQGEKKCLLRSTCEPIIIPID